MFTGIIRHVGSVRSAAEAGESRRLRVNCGPLSEQMRPGDSLAVAGACLTAVSVAGTDAEFDVGGETLSRTALGRLAAGSRVNLERPLRVGDRLDGHLVQGHVDGTAEVVDIRRGEPWVMVFSAGRELTDPMVPKGSIAVDGVSLTLVEVAEDRFSVALIPTTLEETTLGELGISDVVNVETDVLSKYVRRWLSGVAASPDGLTLDKLREAGFV